MIRNDILIDTSEASSLVDTSEASSLVALLRHRATHLGDKLAFRFVPTHANEEVSLTYRAFDARAMAIGAELQRLTHRGERALLLYPQGLDFIVAFFGCLYAGVVAVPVSPPRRNWPTASLDKILSESGPALVLSTSDCCEEATNRYAHMPDLLELPWIATDEISADCQQTWSDPHVDGDQLAFLQFTSGSTAEPKGVMLSHENLLHNSELIHRSFGTTPQSGAVFWLPLYHDMGLIGGVIQPIYCGGSCTLLAPATFLQRPRLWLETISRTGATIGGAPDFAYSLCARKIPPEERDGLDLSHWEVAFTGAERIRASTLDRFADAFGPCGFRREAFYPCYGLAETTLIVSGGPRLSLPTVLHVDAKGLGHNLVRDVSGNGTRSRPVVGCGSCLPGQQVEIVDPETCTRCPEGHIGEIWVSGRSVAQGYCDQPVATQATFHARLADTDEGRFLRTGDLGFLQDGQLFVTGRLKDLVIVRGRNFYPEDIEQTVEQAHDGFRPGHGAAFSVDVEDQERLVVVQEVEPRRRDLDTDSALQAIRCAIADYHELEVYSIVLAKAGDVPKTTSGKTRRSACRQRYLDGDLNAIAQWTADVTDAESDLGHSTNAGTNRSVTAREIEQWLTERIAARLRTEPDKIRLTTPFLEFGIGSLDAVQISADLECWLGRRLSPTAVYNYPNIEALSRHLTSHTPRQESINTFLEVFPAAGEGTPEEILQEVKELSEEEMERYILQEMAKQEGT